MTDATGARVFIANFGHENYLWPDCLARATIATLEDEDLHELAVRGDRDAYLALCVAKKKTARGLTPTLPVAARWFNLAPTISSTNGDLWIHREKEALWWTTSLAGEPTIELKPSHRAPDQKVYEFHKPATPWSNKNRKNVVLSWKGLHPKAREFLFTEGTLQQLSAANAAYARAVIDGASLDQWHDSPAWKAKADASKHGAVTTLNALQRTFLRIARTAADTAAGANGQQVLRTMKNKNFGFGSEAELIEYLGTLYDSQEGLCAMTGIRLQLDGEHDDKEFLCSLDRIDSSGHYEAGNLQIVCRFINRWKGTDENAGFRRLIEVVRAVARATG